MLGAGGLGIQDEDKDWDFGTGAGFYVDATKEPWSEAYRMYSYINEELPDTVLRNFPEIDGERISITGHSMGGHGALILVSLVSTSVLVFKLTSPCFCRFEEISFSKTQANTDPFPPSLQFPTLPHAHGVKRPSPATLATMIEDNGLSMMRPNL